MTSATPPVPAAAAAALRRRRVSLLAGVSLLFALLLLAVYGRMPDTATLQIVTHAITTPAGTDSSFYMAMGEHAFRTGDHRIFPHLFFEQHEKFIYPPSSLFLTEGLDRIAAAGINADLLRKVLLVLAWIGSLVTGVLFYRSLAPQASIAEIAAVLLLGILSLPLAEAFYRGQVQLLLTLLWLVAAFAWSSRRPATTGFLLALTCAFKPQLGIFLLWGLLRRHTRFAAAFAITFAVILAASLLHFGLRNNLDYLPVLSYLSRHGEALYANQSVNGLMNRLLRNGSPGHWDYHVYAPYSTPVYIVSTLATLLLVAAALLLPLLQRWRSSLADFLFCGGACVLASPIAWEHHYGYFFPAILFLLAYSGFMPQRRFLVLAACTLAIANRIPPFDHRQAGALSLFGDYMLFAGLALLLLLAHQGRTSNPVDSSATH